MVNSLLLDISYIIAIILEIAVPLILATIIWKRYRTSWAIFFLGMSFFILSLVRIPVNILINNFFSRIFSGGIFLISTGAFASFTAGLFEEGVRVLAFGLVLKRTRSFDRGLMYGIGHGGGGESMLFVGFSVLANFLVYKFFPFILPADALGQIANIAWYTPLIGALERIFAIAIQISLSILVLYAFMRKKYIFIFFAFLYHFIIDFTTICLMDRIGIFYTELMVFLYALIGVLIVLLLRKRIVETGKNNF